MTASIKPPSVESSAKDGTLSGVAGSAALQVGGGEPLRAGACRADPHLTDSREGRLSALPRLAGEFAYTLIQEEEGSSYLEWASEPLQRVLGLEPGMALAAVLERLALAEDAPRLQQWLAAVRAGHYKPCEHRVRDARGLLFWVNHLARATALGDGSLRIDAELYDITESKLSQEALLESESRYRALAEHASDIICELDHEQRVVFLNRTAERMLGKQAEDLLGLTLRELVQLAGADAAESAQLLANLGWTLDGCSAGPARLRLAQRDGGRRWIEFRGSSFHTARGTLHRVLVGRDVTELLQREEEQTQVAERLEREVTRRTEALAQANDQLRRLQLRLVYAERLGAAEELAARMAHAVNNPLAALLGTIEMELESVSGHSPRLIQMKRLAQRIRDVLENTLTLVREGNLKLAEEDPGKLLEEVRAELAGRAARAGSRIELEIQPGLPSLAVDRALLGAALVSVAENGLDAMEERGGGSLLLQVVAEGDMLRFVVKDQGPGIPVQCQRRIFEPFFTTKPSGTGLGLPIAQGIVRGHGGRLTVCNRAEGGTVAVVTLPLRADLEPLGAAHR